MYITVNANLSPGQINKLKSKSAKEYGATITLKPSQMNTGGHTLLLTTTQKNITMMPLGCDGESSLHFRRPQSPT